jgi:hypothetical protein
MIAAGPSLGWSIEKLPTMYRELGRIVFRKRKFLPLRAWSKHPAKPLCQHLEAKLGEHTLGDQTIGDPSLRTILIIVMHNRTTDSPWPLCNIPNALSITSVVTTDSAQVSGLDIST